MTIDANALALCIDQLRMLNGLPPYDEPGNIVRGDAYFHRSIKRAFDRDTLNAAEQQVQRETEEWELIRHHYLRQRNANAGR